MEWPEYLESSNSHGPIFDMFNASPNDYPEVTTQVDKWTPEEKQFFESGLPEIVYLPDSWVVVWTAYIPPSPELRMLLLLSFAKYNNQDSQTLFEFVASKLPHKSMEDIKAQYITLLQGIEMENPPKNNDVVVVVTAAEDDHDQQHQQMPQEDHSSDKEATPPNGVLPPRVENSRPRRRRGIPWTKGEHQLFLMGLNRYGKGDWKSISRYYVVSKTPTQVASHAQKYFYRRNNRTPVERRRASINDIQTVTLNPRTTPTSTVETTHQINNGRFAYNNNHQAGSSSVSFHYPNYLFGGPIFSNNFNGNFGRFYRGEASGSNSFVMGQNNINNNILRRPVSPRPFLSTYLSSKGV